MIEGKIITSGPLIGLHLRSICHNATAYMMNKTPINKNNAMRFRFIFFLWFLNLILHFQVYHGAHRNSRLNRQKQ